MPYLQAVIKEGLRIFPPAAGLVSKVVPPGGDTYKGVFIPEGTKIGYCGWGLFRDKKIWGDDAHLFRPERWLETATEQLREMNAALEIIFGYGRWQCLGKNVAMIELNKVLVEASFPGLTFVILRKRIILITLLQLLRHFDLSVVDPLKPWKTYCAGIFIQSGMLLSASRRSPPL